MEENKATQIADVETSSEIGELAAALAVAQGEIKGAIKDAENPYFKSSYADLASVWDACRSALSKNGLAVVQTTTDCEFGKIRLVTRLIHKSGQWIKSALLLKPMKDDPQALGSAITYGRRYSLAAMVGVAPEDDDGNAASGKKSELEEYKAEQKRKFDADPKNETYRKETSEPGTKSITPAQKASLLKAAALPSFVGIKDTLTGMVKTLTFADAEILLSSLRSEPAKDSPKAKLRGMVNRMGDGYSVDELKFAALSNEEAQGWIENFDPMDCPFITLNERGE